MYESLFLMCGIFEKISAGFNQQNVYSVKDICVEVRTSINSTLNLTSNPSHVCFGQSGIMEPTSENYLVRFNITTQSSFVVVFLRWPSVSI